MNIFSLRNWETFKVCNIFQIFKLSVFLLDLFINKARKLKVAESNQAKASLTEKWLATDKANRSPVV